VLIGVTVIGALWIQAGKTDKGAKVPDDTNNGITPLGQNVPPGSGPGAGSPASNVNLVMGNPASNTNMQPKDLNLVDAHGNPKNATFQK